MISYEENDEIFLLMNAVGEGAQDSWRSIYSEGPTRRVLLMCLCTSESEGEKGDIDNNPLHSKLNNRNLKTDKRYWKTKEDSGERETREAERGEDGRWARWISLRLLSAAP